MPAHTESSSEYDSYSDEDGVEEEEDPVVEVAAKPPPPTRDANGRWQKRRNAIAEPIDLQSLQSLQTPAAGDVSTAGGGARQSLAAGSIVRHRLSKRRVARNSETSGSGSGSGSSEEESKAPEEESESETESEPELQPEPEPAPRGGPGLLSESWLVQSQPYSDVPLSAPAEKEPTPEELVLELRTAAMGGDRPWVERLVARGVALDEPDGNGWTPLHWAVSNGELGATTALLRGGADVDRKNANGCSPLFWAATVRLTGTFPPATHFLIQF